MNRMDEYKTLLAELEDTPVALEYTITRARARRRRRVWLWQPVTTLAGLFVAFVLLVNVSQPVAYAMSRVPGLDKLAEAVTFSRSLTAAVDNDFVQPVEQTQTDNGITMSVEYLIVDQKQVNVFYSLEGEGYDWLSATPQVFPAEGDPDFEGGVTITSGGNQPDVLQHVSIDFVDGNVPERLRLTMKVTGHRKNVQPPTASVEDDMFNTSEEWAAELEEKTLAALEFTLTFDPAFTGQGRTLAVNRSVTVDGQTLTVTELGIYPTHARLNVTTPEENTAWLKGLTFYVENRRGERYDPASSGVTATGDGAGQMVSYRMDSTWFYEEKHLTLVITGAEWLDKDKELVRLDLTTGTADWMPQGTELYALERREKGWVVKVLAKLKKEDGPMYSVFSGPWLDAAGNEHDIRTWSASHAYDEDDEPMEGYFIESFPLLDCEESEVWLQPTFSRLWTAEKPVRLDLS